MTIALKALAGLVALLLGLLGLRWMFAPIQIATEMGIVLGDALALNTARGDIGGTFVACALLCALGLARGEGRWLQAVAAVIGGVALGRVVGMLADGFLAASAAACGIELLMVTVLLAAARRDPAGA